MLQNDPLWSSIIMVLTHTHILTHSIAIRAVGQKIIMHLIYIATFRVPKDTKQSGTNNAKNKWINKKYIWDIDWIDGAGSRADMPYKKMGFSGLFWKSPEKSVGIFQPGECLRMGAVTQKALSFKEITG